IRVDITERKQTEENLQKSLKEVTDYKYALDESSIVAITDQKGIIKYANDNFCKISKYNREELIGQDHRIINSGYHPQEFIRNLWVTIANGKIWKGELKNKAKDGTIYWVDTTIIPFLNEQGKPYQYVAIRADITERKKVEEEMLLLNEELEDRINIRTNQLQISNKELEAFSYSVSHDLRAPLRGVSGYSRILKETYGSKLDTEGNRIIERIIRNSKMMGQLIDDLLTFSGMGRKEVTPHSIDMKFLAESCIEELLQNNPVNKCRIHVHPLPSCEGDATMIKQVWMNLLSNALKYSAKTIEPEIEIGFKDDEFMRIYFIRDNGVGFEMEYVHKLFGVFQRLHSHEQFEGTGVGLALVKRIINKHNGDVWAEATPGEGATFYFSLPATRIALPGDENQHK
ncbi:MAG TPA: ATP-binding protein, partial [Chitinophagaceae bacterium]|nr:ATP-binding protein [Chitinophagaceae bacterium]